MVGIFNDLWLLVICHTILHEFLIFHSDKQVLKASCDKMDENDVQPGNEVFILSGKKETSSKTETSKIAESNVELKSMSDYGENGNIPEGKCSKILNKFCKGSFTNYVYKTR